MNSAARPAGLIADGCLDFYFAEEVALGEDDELFVFDLDFLAGVLGVEDAVADADFHGDDLAVVVAAAGADSDDFTLVGLFAGGVRDNDARREDFFLNDGA